MLLAQAGTHAFARRTLAGPDPALALILVAPPIRESSGLLTDPSECDRPDNPKTLVVVPVVRVVPVAGAAALPRSLQTTGPLATVTRRPTALEGCL